MFIRFQAMADQTVKLVSDTDLKELKQRMKLISDADPLQYHNEFSLRRYLRAFKTVDAAFQVGCNFYFVFQNAHVSLLVQQFLIVK